MSIYDSKRFLISTLILLILFTLWHPGDEPAKASTQRRNALQPVRHKFPVFNDDMDAPSLSLAVKRNLSYLMRLNPDKVFQYGPHPISCREVMETQTSFLGLISSRLDTHSLNKKIVDRFSIYRAAGRRQSNKVLFTAYYEPVFKAKLTPDEIYKYPIYRKPQDLIRVDLSLFGSQYGEKKIIARVEDNKVLPYYTRHQIEAQRLLAGNGLEIAWLKDPMDVYLLHIEGAGRLTLPDGKSILVNYDASNGRPYRSFGKFLIDKGYLARSDLSIDKIRKYLASHPGIRKTVLSHNESYTFFKQVEEGPLGNLNVPLTKGRSLALDDGLFPKGALAFMRSKKPNFNMKSGKVSGWKDFSRFVLNQDTGSAIKGPGRADLFWGSGQKAKTAAWQFKQDGELYFLLKKY